MMFCVYQPKRQTSGGSSVKPGTHPMKGFILHIARTSHLKFWKRNKNAYTKDRIARISRWMKNFYTTLNIANVAIRPKQQ